MNTERKVSWVIPVTLLIIAITLVWWLDQRRRTAPEARIEHPQNADYYLLTAKITTTNVFGKPAYEMTADKILYFPDRTTSLETVHAYALGGAESNWDARAQQGWVNAENDQINLMGNVTMIGNIGEEPVTVKSEAMTIYPDDERIESDQLVTIQADTHETQAQGMRGEFRTRRLELFNNVETIYRPQ